MIERIFQQCCLFLFFFQKHAFLWLQSARKTTNISVSTAIITLVRGFVHLNYISITFSPISWDLLFFQQHMRKHTRHEVRAMLTQHSTAQNKHVLYGFMSRTSMIPFKPDLIIRPFPSAQAEGQLSMILLPGNNNRGV